MEFNSIKPKYIIVSDEIVCNVFVFQTNETNQTISSLYVVSWSRKRFPDIVQLFPIKYSLIVNETGFNLNLDNF